jgi:hypothetical protein
MLIAALICLKRDYTGIEPVSHKLYLVLNCTVRYFYAYYSTSVHSFVE